MMKKILFDDGQNTYFIYERRAGIACVSVQYRSPGKNRNRRLREYRFPDIQEIFESPYLSWRNLYCCGGWGFDSSILDTAVQEGTKLFAGRIQTLQNEYCMTMPTMEEAQRDFELFKASFPPGVYGAKETVLPAVANDGYFRSYICRDGSIADYFNMDKVFEHYHKLGVELAQFQEEILRLSSIEINMYGTDKAPYQYYCSNSVPKLVTTGLLLGYPIESTVSCLLESKTF